jgi:uncharacterized membrane protein
MTKAVKMTNHMAKRLAQEYLTWMKRGHMVKLIVCALTFILVAFDHYLTSAGIGALLIILILETNNIRKHYNRVSDWTKD